MQAFEGPLLADDQPKSNPWIDDRLGYKPFAELLSTTILQSPAPNGLVIGIHAGWGTGKSTALNFITAFLDKHNQETEKPADEVTVIRFEPWIVSGHQDLVAAFFGVLAEALGDPDGWFKRQRKRVGRWLGSQSKTLSESFAKIGSAIDPSGATSVAASWAGAIVNALTAKLNAPRPLQTIYADLVAQLQKDRRRFVIIIDDVDRLSADEIRAIMQMVKTVGRLPNVIYLLAYDRKIVAQALSDQKGLPAFHEKIMQHEAELPKPRTRALLKILDEEIHFLTGSIPETLRWNYITRDGVQRWIKGPRDVVKLTNAVKFSWAALRGEVDPADILAMEGLKLFEPEVFAWVRNNRDFLFGDGWYTLARDVQLTAAVADLKKIAGDSQAERVLSLLTALFPRRAKQFDDRSPLEGDGDVLQRTRIGTRQGFDAYFGLHLGNDAISNALLSAIFEKQDDIAALRQLISPYVAVQDEEEAWLIGLIYEAIRLRVEASEQPIMTPNSMLLRVILELGEQVFALRALKAIVQSPPKRELDELIYALLKSVGPEQGGGQLVAAVEAIDSVAVTASVYVSRARERGHLGGRLQEIVIEEPEIRALEVLLLARIRTAREAGILSAAPVFGDIVRAWKFLAGPEEPRAWLRAAALESADTLFKICRGITSRSIGSTQFHTELLGSLDEDIYEPTALEEACRAQLTGQLTPEQTEMFTAVMVGFQELQERRNL